MHTKDKGDWSEAEVIAKLKSIMDCFVFTPFGDNTPYDIVIDINGELLKIQVKTARYVNGSIKFETRSANSNMNESWHTTYGGLIDWFAVYSPDMDECYAVHIDECGSSSKTLRVEEPDVSNPNINWAEDYVLDEDTFEEYL